jgi:membrane-associated phospholipid phosphatase
MTDPGPDVRSRTEWTPAWRVLAFTAVAFAAACLADPWVYEQVHDPKVYERDWGRLLRVIGFLGTWVALAVAVALHEGSTPARRDAAQRRAWLLFGSAALGGIVAEIGKLLLRRERPQAHDGLYGFRDFADRTWSTSGLALPSSHTLVAFAGAAMFARLFPRARWVGYTLATGCAVTRVMARAHFLSDVVLAAGLGWLVAFALTRRWSTTDAAELGTAAATK